MAFSLSKKLLVMVHYQSIWKDIIFNELFPLITIINCIESTFCFPEVLIKKFANLKSRWQDVILNNLHSTETFTAE